MTVGDGEMHRHRARMRHAVVKGRRGRIDGMRRYFDGRHGTSEHGGAAASRDFLTTRGARRDKAESLIEAETVAAIEAVAAAREASPAMRQRRSQDAIVAEQEAAGPCRKTRRGRRTRRHGNCIAGHYAAMRVRIVLVEGRRIAQQN